LENNAIKNDGLMHSDTRSVKLQEIKDAQEAKALKILNE
tara:strand:- start:323 stop:439 length:117 start_codon:yes stop_codon:yes gene_type:complete